MPELNVLAVNCSPTAGGRTRTVLEAVLEGARGAGAETSLLELADYPDVSAAVDALDGADAFAFGSPMYRATFAAPFKALVDATPRGMYGEDRAPLTGRAVLTVATAASDHHFLGPAGMRDILIDFFAAHIVSPGVYVPNAGFDESKTLQEPVATKARQQGQALVELARGIQASDALKSVTPNA
jgi:multimeric flavodoxin WrbA